jgi:hypothetical protein
MMQSLTTKDTKDTKEGKKLYREGRQGREGNLSKTLILDKYSGCPRLEGAIDVVLRVLCGEAVAFPLRPLR